MAIIPVRWCRPIPAAARGVLERLPTTWVDDGLSCFPDSILGWDIAWCGTIHDARYCSRLWPAGSMDVVAKRRADLEIRDNVWAALPFGLRLTGYVVFLGVWRGGYGSFDSCGPVPLKATQEQLEQGRCRHGVHRPAWMTL